MNKTLQVTLLATCTLGMSMPSHAGWLSDNKAVVGAVALGAVNLVSNKAEAEKKAKEDAEQQEVEKQAKDEEKASGLAMDAKIEGNFGLKLGETLNTSKCLKGTLKASKCYVPLNGNTFFKKAYVLFNPETKEIAQISGVKAVKHFEAPKNMQGSNSSLEQKRQHVGFVAGMYPTEQGTLIWGALRDKGILGEIDSRNVTGWFYDSERKRMWLSDEVIKTNMGNPFESNPFMDVEISFHYMDKTVYAEMVDVESKKKEQARKASMEGNF